MSQRSKKAKCFVRPTTHLQSQQLLTGFNVSLDLTCHRLNDFNTVLVENIEHVADAETWRGSREQLCYSANLEQLMSLQSEHLQ